MTESDPEQAILDALARPPGRWQPGPRSPGGIQAGLVRGGNPFRGDLSTVRFIKHRGSEQRRVHFVTFDGSIPQLGSHTHTFGYVFALERDVEGSWRVIGEAGGGDYMPARPTPWVNLAGGGWPHHFYAGGRIHDAGIHIARVQLRFADGLTLTDDSEEAVALFITDKTVHPPATIVLHDPPGNQIATHPAFPDLSARP